MTSYMPVNSEEFNAKLTEFYTNRPGSNRTVWKNEHMLRVKMLKIKMLEC